MERLPADVLTLVLRYIVPTAGALARGPLVNTADWLAGELLQSLWEERNPAAVAAAAAAAATAAAAYDSEGLSEDEEEDEDDEDGVDEVVEEAVAAADAAADAAAAPDMPLPAGTTGLRELLAGPYTSPLFSSTEPF